MGKEKNWAEISAYTSSDSVGPDCGMEIKHGRDLSHVILTVSGEWFHSHEDVSRWFTKSVLIDLALWVRVSPGFGKTLAEAQYLP